MTSPCRFAIGLIASAFAPAVFGGPKDRTLDVYWIDTEGGAATLIVTPAGESVLIDAGNAGGVDAGRVVTVARDAGLSRIDFLLITHWHPDHFGGAAEVAQQIPIGLIYQRTVPDADPDGLGRPGPKMPAPFPVLIKPFNEIAAPRAGLAPGVTVPLKAAELGPKVELRCLAAEEKWTEPEAVPRAEASKKSEDATDKPRQRFPENDRSAVFVLSFGNFRLFDGGDLTWAVEHRLVSAYNVVGTVDVFRTDHHGLDDANNPELVQALAPTVAVVNNGSRKGGQAGTLATLKKAPSIEAWYQLHRSMKVPDGANAPAEMIANLEDPGPSEKCAGNYIRMAVSSDGKSYTFSIPANGHSRTFRTKK